MEANLTGREEAKVSRDEVTQMESEATPDDNVLGREKAKNCEKSSESYMHEETGIQVGRHSKDSLSGFTQW